MRRSGIVALCVVLVFGASVAMTSAAERTTAYTLLTQTFEAVMARIMTPAGDPISPPIPLVKPDRNAAPAPGIIAQCGPARIVAGLAKDGQTPIYRATFDPGMVDDMVGKGCAQFYQGCNICSIRYTDCSDEARAKCTDAACLEKTCTRQVMCSAKTCTIQGKTPTCESRIARTACRRPLFN